MAGLPYRISVVGAVAVISLGAAHPLRAQCGNTAAIGASVVSMAPANPFQAVRTITHTPPRDPRLPEPLLMKPEAIARDSQGRVRSDSTVGEWHMESGPDAGADVKQHIVRICDPVKGEVIQLDNVNHAATTRKLTVLRNPQSSPAAVVFCRVPQLAENFKGDINIEDLGHRDIEGFDAMGWRVTTHAHMPNSTPDATVERIRETWCSEALNAVLLEVLSGGENGPKEEIALTQIQRIEPDPSLFEIPPDYTVSESVQSPHFRGSVIVSPQSLQPPLVTH